MNHLIQNVVTKEANDKNLTTLLHVNVTVKNFDDQNVQVQYTGLSLIDVHIIPELNGSLNKQVEDRINGYIRDQIASRCTKYQIQSHKNNDTKILFALSPKNYKNSYNNWVMFKIAPNMTNSKLFDRIPRHNIVDLN